MLKRFLISYVLGLILFGSLLIGINSKINPSEEGFRPEPLQAEGISIEEVMPE